MFDSLLETAKFLIANPLVALASFGVAFIIYWINSRLFRGVLRQQAETNRAGWTTSAIASTQRHETGTGTTDVLIMRPPRRLLRASLFTLLFFGSGAVFFWLAVLPEPEEQTFKNWSAFVIMCTFSALAIFLFFHAFTRIRVTSEEIVRRRFFVFSQKFLLSEISDVEMAGKNPATGVKLVFTDKRPLKLLAQYEGYAEVLAKIQHAHPKLSKYLMLGRFADSVNSRNAQY